MGAWPASPTRDQGGGASWGQGQPGRKAASSLGQLAGHSVCHSDQPFWLFRSFQHSGHLAFIYTDYQDLVNVI